MAGNPDVRATPRSVAIIGGGISGLAAAFLLRDRGLAVTVLEGSPRLGGKLAVSDVAGVAVDSGAEALLARRPEGTGLIIADAYGAHMHCEAPEHRLPAPTRKSMTVRFAMAAAQRINRLVDPQGHGGFF